MLSVADALTSPAGTEVDPTKQAIELVAAGAGVLVLPQSVARLYNRKDVRAVPLTEGHVVDDGRAEVQGSPLECVRRADLVDQGGVHVIAHESNLARARAASRAQSADRHKVLS